MAYAHDKLLGPLLRDVSRSFYLTLRVLPQQIRPQISLAYLLARTTDTIADTEILPLERRIQALRALRERILALSNAPLEFQDLAAGQAFPAERALLENVEVSLAFLRNLPAADLEPVLQVLSTITSGQELDLVRFAGSSAEVIVALRTDAELDDYTYRVAGCVGEFWTRMCRAHLFPETQLEDAVQLANGVRFGKGLQLVNVLRDLPADLRHGRCYLPGERLSELALSPSDLLDSGVEGRLRPLYNEYLDVAENHLRAGWTYTTMLPRDCVRVRLACAWPLLIGIETLQLLRKRNVLDPAQRVKVSRWRVKQLMVLSVLFHPWPRAWSQLFEKRTRTTAGIRPTPAGRGSR
jgi:farnesyl-diphosphate farnesyltransferase